MKVVIELSDEEIEKLEEAVGYPVKDEDDAVYSLHILLDKCM